MPDGPAVCDGDDRLATWPLGDTVVNEPKFNDTIGAVDILVLGALTDEGDTPLTIKDEVGVEITPKPSPNLNITTLKGTPTIGGPNGLTCSKMGSLRSVRGEL